MAKKALLINIPLGLHARLKFRSQQESVSMNAIVTRLIEEYLGMPIEPTYQEVLADEFENLLAGDHA